MIDNKYLEIFEKFYSDDINNVEEVLLELKKSGASQMQCTRLLMLNLKLSIAEADRVVINSEPWEDYLNSVEEVRESYFNINFEEEEE